jgi:type II secretory pathway pseudopilin PulG
MARGTQTGSGGRRDGRRAAETEVRSMQDRARDRCAARGREGQRGFTLAAVVILMAVMAVFLGVAVQTVSFQQQREKEEELIFRGNQIVEGIRIFRARFGRFPLSLDELFKAKPRCMRKHWLDPITGKDDWAPVFLGQEGTSLTGGAVKGLPEPTPVPTPQSTSSFGSEAGRQARGPIVGVHSPSCDKSIKLVDGRDRYCDWKFVYDPRKLTQTRALPPRPTPRSGF